MKSIVLERLALRNFKGIREFVLDTQGSTTNVYGDNAIGKTTLFDAFTWLLFDKDSQNKKDFEIKTLDKQGKVLHNLEHEVEGVLLINGKRVTLRKVYAEKWTKKRGSATSEFTGHSTEYFVDGVPVKKNDYTDRVSDIVQEDIFKLLTSPSYFNEQTHWQERRKILLAVCGDISDEEVIASNKGLSKLQDILGDRSIEDHRKVIAAERKKINDELEKIPVRIDEAYRSMPDVEDTDVGKMNEQLSILAQQIEDKQAELSRTQNGGEISVKENRLREIEGELLVIKNRVQGESLDKIAAARQLVSTIKSEGSELRNDITDKKRTLERNKQQIDSLRVDMEQLRQRWNTINAETLEHHQDENCAACGQSLPADQVQAAHDKALADFNLAKSKRLEDINARGKSASAEVKQLEKENERLSTEINTLEKQLETKAAAFKKAEAELFDLQEGVQDVAADPEYITKQKELEIVRSEILGLRSQAQGVIDNLRLELSKLRTSVELIERDKAKVAQAETITKRISQLGEQEKELAAQFEKLEQELYLSEEFIRTKVTLLESKINAKFKFARFKLFEPQINGGLSEVCETTFNGVPYSSGLNNAARINVGLDIINTLSEHYGFSAPIFVDNAEAVTKMISTNSQVINLIVSEKDKQLRVETHDENMREAV